MTEQGKRDISVTSKFVQQSSSFEHEIGPFADRLDGQAAHMLARFIWSLCQPDERPLLGFCPLVEDQLRLIAESGWQTLQRRDEIRIRRHLGWLIGCTDNVDFFGRVYQAAWNGANNEPVVVVIAPRGDSGDRFAEIEQRDGVYPGNEERLLGDYPTVVGRYDDGLCVKILTRTLGPEEIGRRLPYSN